MAMAGKMIQIKTLYMAIFSFAAPIIVIGAILAGAYIHHSYYKPPVDPQAVDELREQMAELRETIIIEIVKNIDISGCKVRNWDVQGEFIPRIGVTGSNCKIR